MCIYIYILKYIYIHFTYAYEQIESIQSHECMGVFHTTGVVPIFLEWDASLYEQTPYVSDIGISSCEFVSGSLTDRAPLLDFRPLHNCYYSMVHGAEDSTGWAVGRC